MTRQLGVAHLTLLSLTPPKVVEAAAAAGLDFVGIRVRGVTSAEHIPPMHLASVILRDTITRLKDTGVIVRDIEFLPITADIGSDDWRPALEAGAALGATVMTIAGADTDLGRLRDTISRLAADAAPFGIRPVLEPISYQSVSRVADAAAIARATGIGLMLDPLHIQRGGSSLAEVSVLEPDLVPMLQLCDAPLKAPTGNGPRRIQGLQHEARQDRLMVGEGELPLAALLAATPMNTPASIEIPNVRRQSTIAPHEWLMLNVRAARALIERADSARAIGAGQDG